MNKLRIAVAGAGLIGRRHVELIAESEQCELAAIVDPSASAVELARRAGVPLHRSITALFAGQRPDAVIAATPNSLHAENAIDCIEHGVPVLIEKPVADSIANATRLMDIVERSNVPVLVGHHRRHSPILEKAREIVQAGTLGRIVAVIGSAMFYKPDSYFEQGPWRRRPGGGPILINMIHEVDDLRVMCDEIVEVQALSSNATRGFAVEDTVAINLRFACGALGTFLLSDTAATARSWEQTSGENPSYASYPDEDCYLIAGVAGSIAVPTLRLKIYDGERSWWKPFRTSVVAVEHADPLSRQLAHFCAVVSEKAAPLVSVRDALQTLRVTLAIDEATRTRRPVSTIGS
ncbi:MAG: Gfo/Idh/MocA family oxidoreductase [Pseudomonadota bacterium]|nr:Gfo/Idh/MocA family oxidoreductase [Pseudomonadota bacterium]